MSVYQYTKYANSRFRKGAKIRTPETVLNDAKTAIEAAKRNGCIGGFLCYSGNQLRVIRNKANTLPSLTFFKLTEKHFQEGLTLQEWNHLKYNLWQFFEERI